MRPVSQFMRIFVDQVGEKSTINGEEKCRAGSLMSRVGHWGWQNYYRWTDNVSFGLLKSVGHLL